MKLSKREMILLFILLIIGLSFLEYSVIVTPGLAKYSDLKAKEVALDNEIDTINLNLTLAKTMEKTLNENLQKISALSQPYLSGVSPDALLLFTHNMMTKHGFISKSYGPSPLNTRLLQPESAELVKITYRIKEIAKAYKTAGIAKTNTTTETKVTNEENTAANDIVECYTLQVTATGSFDQIKLLLDDYDSLNRYIQVSNISMEPNTTAANLLNIEFMINYYGIEKLVPVEDPINVWTQNPMNAKTTNPYAG